MPDSTDSTVKGPSVGQRLRRLLAPGIILLLAVGLLCTVLFPVPASLSSTNTLWGWLAEHKRANLHVVQIGETP